MFELDKYERRPHDEPPATPAQAYEPAANVEQISLLFWGEHCVECAAPSCYQSCDLYQARPDMRCRRFKYGAFKNRKFASLRGYGVEVSFKKWAKIEAFGNLALHPLKFILARETQIERAAQIIHAANLRRGLGRATAGDLPPMSVVGKAFGDFTNNGVRDIREASEHLVRRLHNARSAGRLPHAFLLEVYNPTTETVRLQVIFSPATDDVDGNDRLLAGPSFTTTLSFPSGYSRHELAASRLHAVIATGKSFKVSMIPEGDNNARLVFLTADFVNFAKEPIAADETKQVKCLVWDLDNTLWNGVLIEGDHVVVRPEIVSLLDQLDERGILLSIASKNDHAYAWQKLQQLGLSEYFLYPQINWAPKAANIKAIAERLNIGVDALAFVDDDPFELDQVARALPGVVCLSTACFGSLVNDARFQGGKSPDAHQRRHLYQDAIARETAQLELGSGDSEFLATCGITLEIAPYAPEDSERVAELVQRTNQLNFSGQRYTRAMLDEVVANPQLEKYVLRSSDKYGSYGTVGFCIVEPGASMIKIRDFMLSCRVQGKFIEQAVFHHLFEHHNADAATVLWLNFRLTERNKPAQQVLHALGFHKCEAEAGVLPAGMLHSTPQSLACDFINVQCFLSPAEIGRTNEETGIPDFRG